MAIASLIIGSIAFLNALSLYAPLVLPYPIPRVIYDLFILSPPIGIVGLSLGILAVIRKKRGRIAIAGIVLNSIPILFVIFFLMAPR
jgi:hypothetical protein